MSLDPDAAANSNPKKLRFITNQGAPNPKRRRIQAACLNCRRRKTACSGEHPSCSTCIQNKLQCSGYAKSASKDDAKLGSTHGHPRNDSNASIPPPRPPKPSLASEDSFASPTGLSASTKASTNPAIFSTQRNRMPYFRWLGPTAIMPGFKQMVVKVKRHRSAGAASSTDENAAVSPGINSVLMGSHRGSLGFSATPMAPESDIRTPLTLPFYDTSAMPPSELITHLCGTFFTHLGCSFPFLQKVRFLKDLEAKQVDAILVDAVCAMAARFSDHALIVEQADENGRATPAEYGQAFAQRAKAALLDTYAMPTVAAVQAALLLAYNEFGESRDSGLWIYLGLAIRMAQDLGLQKVEGLRLEGRDGPTPRMIKTGQSPQLAATTTKEHKAKIDQDGDAEVRAVERERVDTFWSVFFLDKVVSSGTGRRSTLRDNDIELSFPPLDNTESLDGWPSPFPAAIRIIHLYGRVVDLINSVKESSDITPDVIKKLAEMEAKVTDFYQSLSSRLHFEAMNFHHYVKAGDGTTFILVHFWFHSLIILLHQPTLLKTFEGKSLKLFPNSQQLSMSSAKTIADIISYSQLIDTKALLGNPFTTQPIYIAICTFLKETAERTASAGPSRAPSRVVSRAVSPDRSHHDGDGAPSPRPPNTGTAASAGKPNAVATKHALLVKRATQDYQLCYKALQTIETFWAGTKYIITVIDQKIKGVGDPLLYTAEEIEKSLEEPRPAPAFTSPGWRRNVTWTPTPNMRNDATAQAPKDSDFGFPSEDDLNQAIGWTMTGDLNSTNTNLSWHFPSTAAPNAQPGMVPMRQPKKKHARASEGHAHATVPAFNRTTSSASLPAPTINTQSIPPFPKVEDPLQYQPGIPYAPNETVSPLSFESSPVYFPQDTGGPTSTALFGDIMIESQDVDMSVLGFDMLSWINPMQSDASFMDDGTTGGGGLT